MIIASRAIRPDEITRTGVIEPYPIARGPVNLARRVPNQFVRSVRPLGPAFVQPPSAQSIANAAAAVAVEFSKGKSAKVVIGGRKQVVRLRDPACPGVIGKITEAARLIAAGKPALVRAQGQSAVAWSHGVAAQRPMSYQIGPPVRPARPGRRPVMVAPRPAPVPMRPAPMPYGVSVFRPRAPRPAPVPMRPAPMQVQPLFSPSVATRDHRLRIPAQASSPFTPGAFAQGLAPAPFGRIMGNPMRRFGF